MNLNQQVTAVIKTFERPYKLLDLVASIRRYYPLLPIVIVDDSAKKLSSRWDKKTKYVPVAYDVGLSKGRNIVLREVKTPYSLLLDDDFIFTADTKLALLVDVLENHHFDLVAGEVIDYGTTPRLFSGEMKILKDKLHLIFHPRGKHAEVYPKLDFVINFFLAKTKILRKFPWDKDLKIREHEVFFWNLKQAGIKVTATNKVAIFHYPDLTNPQAQADYNKMRHGRLAYYHQLACQKIGVSDMVTDGIPYAGLTKLFRYFPSLIAWLRLYKHKKISAKLLWHSWFLLRRLLKFFYQTWQKICASFYS